MSFRRGGVMESVCYLLVLLMTVVSSHPMNGETATDVDTPTTTELSRENNPVYNVWEYAYTNDGPINTRSVSSESAPEDSRSNQCLWAIVSCCNAHSNYERDNCFDALGCPGAWFQNLCSQEYIDVANSQVTSIFSG